MICIYIICISLVIKYYFLKVSRSPETMQNHPLILSNKYSIFFPYICGNNHKTTKNIKAWNIK